jgi:Lysylphosphatidylglycerol synthase TM region/SPW repeat
VLAASGLSVLGEAGLLAVAFEVAGTPVPWRGLLLACAAGQLGARLVPLPGGLGGIEGGVLGALALTGTHPATALTAVIVYRIAGYWAPGAVGAATAALLTCRHPAPAARPVTPLHPQAPQPAPGQPPSPRRAASAAGARAAGPWPAPGRPARLGIKPARAHPTADPASRIPQTAAGHAASARSPPGPGVTGPAVRHDCGPAPLPGSSRTSRRDSHRPPTERRKKEHVMNAPLIRRPDGNGASAEAVQAATDAGDGYALPATWRGIGAQAAAALGMLTGLWVAISPWFITLQYAGGNATAVNLISGLAVAAMGAFALAGPRGVRRPAVRQRAARRLANHRRAHPQPQAPHHRLDVLVQQLGRRGADRPSRRQPGRHRPAPAGPPLTTRTVRVLTGSQDPHPGPADGPAPRDPHRRQSRSSGACYEP